MEISLGFQPNCSETVFRFSHRELNGLSKDQFEAFWKAVANGCTEESVKQNSLSTLGLPVDYITNIASRPTLILESADQFFLSYYQTWNDMLLDFAKNNLKDWMIEAPFTDDSYIPDDHNWEKIEEVREKLSPVSKIPLFSGKQVQPRGWETIMALKDLDNQVEKETEGNGNGQ
jgi:hypothetical protein